MFRKLGNPERQRWFSEMKKNWIWLTVLANALLCFAVSVLYLWYYTGWSLRQNIIVVGAGALATIYPDSLLWYVQMLHLSAIGVLICLVAWGKWSWIRFVVLHFALATYWIWTIHCAVVISSW
jgi:hypothetical protein